MNNLERAYYEVINLPRFMRGSGFLPFEEFQTHIYEFLDLFEASFEQDKTYSILELVSITYAYSFALMALSISSNPDCRYSRKYIVAVRSLLASISNSTIASCLLLRKGLVQEEEVLFRSLYERSYTLLNILIDTKKREAYLSNDGLNLKKGTWSKYFSFKSLNETVKEYEKGILGEKDLPFEELRLRTYSRYSSSAHNGFMPIVYSSFIHDDSDEDDENLSLNIGGILNSRISLSRLETLGDLLFYFALLLRRLIHSEEGVIDPIHIVNEKSYLMWDQALFFNTFSENLYLIEKEKLSFEIIE